MNIQKKNKDQITQTNNRDQEANNIFKEVIEEQVHGFANILMRSMEDLKKQDVKQMLSVISNSSQVVENLQAITHSLREEIKQNQNLLKILVNVQFTEEELIEFTAKNQFKGKSHQDFIQSLRNSKIKINSAEDLSNALGVPSLYTKKGQPIAPGNIYTHKMIVDMLAAKRKGDIKAENIFKPINNEDITAMVNSAINKAQENQKSNDVQKNQETIENVINNFATSLSTELFKLIKNDPSFLINFTKENLLIFMQNNLPQPLKANEVKMPEVVNPYEDHTAIK